ncbi:MAG: WD40 repeat domain-containing protein [Humidesulfovibrio sp.]|uniref:WD40 repeat domain-containing protein n=1 Tax=Humidesulfovibrio sp. TaxID=2910988 RepID=UPI0027FECD4C|nr:WD40 repeat domain-containing protein [Humidesulfovibrio sp.]MDQ7836489.1 WD40 repeat domain-containing protein [Humidesulfovibrio sp.]
MPGPVRKSTATESNTLGTAVKQAEKLSGKSLASRQTALSVGLASLLAVTATCSAFAAEPAQSSVGESYIFNTVAGADNPSGPDQIASSHLGQDHLNQDELLDPSSRLWAGAQALRLRLERSSTLLATNVIAASGDAEAAAASHADGTIQLFGAGNCSSVSMPDGHPAYALALSREGGALAAWAQGVNSLVVFDLRRPDCPHVSSETALRGQISLSLSPTGAFIAAQDEEGRIWVGPRGGEMRVAASLPGSPAAIGFSGGEGVLLVLDANGQGGAWNPRTGKALRRISVPGGPFVRGDFQGMEARLWTRDGRLLRWDMLHNSAPTTEFSPGEALSRQKGGWLELRGADVYFSRPGLSWKVSPSYDPRPPSLSVSVHAGCLRLSDVDGNVRYYDARQGQEREQCFAEDWVPVAVRPDGTAEIPGLRLRLFDTQPSADGHSNVNTRALSETEVYVWTDRPAQLEIRVSAPTANSMRLLKNVGEARTSAMRLISPQLREGIAEHSRTRSIPLE